MAIYTITDNRDIDNENQNWLSSVVSLSSFKRLSADLVDPESDILKDTISAHVAQIDLSGFTKLYHDLSGYLDGLHLSDFHNLCVDVTDLHLSDFHNLCVDVTDLHLSNFHNLCTDISVEINIGLSDDIMALIKKYIDEHGGGGGGASITYKFWSGVDIPYHPPVSGDPPGPTPVEKIDIGPFTMAISPLSSEHTGAEITPDVKIYDLDGIALTLGVDYVVSYANNVNVSHNALATAIGVGEYTGAKYGAFTIYKKPEPPVIDWTGSSVFKIRTDDANKSFGFYLGAIADGSTVINVDWGGATSSPELAPKMLAVENGLSSMATEGLKAIATEK